MNLNSSESYSILGSLILKTPSLCIEDHIVGLKIISSGSIRLLASVSISIKYPSSPILTLFLDSSTF